MFRMSTGAAVIAVLCFAAALVAASGDGTTWSYHDMNAWGTDFPTCKENRQSPINIVSADAVPNTEYGALEFGDGCSLAHTTAVKLLNTHVTIKASFDYAADSDASCTMVDPVSNEIYTLLQVHFHHGSEHTFDGLQAPLVMHWVFSRGDKLSVVGVPLTNVMANASAASKSAVKLRLLDFFLSTDLPTKEGATTTITNFTAEKAIPFDDVFPDDREFYTYSGSLTTPPCSETVQWYVFKNFGYIDTASYNKYYNALLATDPEFEKYGNVRPVQPLNGRTVYSVSAPITAAPTTTPSSWGQGYAVYDMYNNAQCSGTPMPGARTLGCLDSSISMCVTPTILRTRVYTEGNGTCTGLYQEKTLTVGPCIPAPGSDGTIYIKAKRCSKTGSVPIQHGSGVCTVAYENNDCSGKVTASSCKPADVCSAINNNTESVKFNCATKKASMWKGSDTCGGAATHTLPIPFGMCQKSGFKFTSCTHTGTDAPTTDSPVSPAPTSNPTPGEWGQGYAEYDLYNNAQCSGTPMPGARTLGCFKSMEGQCVSSSMVRIKQYNSPQNGTCDGHYIMKTIATGQCIPAPGSDGSLYIKAKSCAKTGAVPMQIDVGYCTDTYSNNDCSGDLQLSECYAINTCLSSNQQYSIKFTCAKALQHTAGLQRIYKGTTCGGTPISVDTSMTNKCSKGEWLRSCSDEAPTTSSPDATTPVTNEPATPVPAPTLPAGSAWGFLVKLTANDTWSNTRYTLRKRLCGGGYSGTYTCLPGYPDYDLVPANDEGKADEFVVSVNQSWMMYDAISIPQYVLEANDIASISALGDVPTTITERGENLVLLKTFTSYDYGNPELKAWKSFRQLRNNAMNTIVGGTNTSDMALVFANYSYNASRDGYEATLIVSMKKLSQQVELAGINWEELTSVRIITSSYVVGASLYPLGVDLDQTTANQLDNRVEFNFTNKNNDYTTFSSFANNLDDVFRVKGSMDVDPQSMQLVKSVATVNDTKIEQSFTVSFETAKQQQKILNVSKEKDGMRQMGWSYQSQSVAYAASPALITPTPTKQSGGGATGDDDGDNSKPKTTLIVVIVVVVVVIVVVIAIAMKMSGKKRVAGNADELEGINSQGMTQV